MTVLVIYASKYGSTMGIAERIAKVLSESGVAVDLQPIAKVTNPAAYDAYVIGGATYMGSWLSGAADFVRHNAPTLASRPTWLFCSGPLGTSQIDAKGRDVIVSAEPKEFADFRQWLRPNAIQVFFGSMDYSRLRGKDRLVRHLPSASEMLPEGDFRDWPAIEAWAAEISSALGGTRTS